MEIYKVTNLLKTMATSDSMDQKSREDALQVILDEPKVGNRPAWLTIIANYFYGIIVYGGVNNDPVLFQEIVDQYTELTKYEVEQQYLMVNFGTPENPVYIPAHLVAKIDHHVRHNEKITAIKMFRDFFGFHMMGLAEAKKIVEAYMNKNKIPYPRPKENIELTPSNCENCNDKSCEKDRQVKDAPGHGVGFD